MDMERRTFTLNDLDETFWKKVLLIKVEPSTGLGGWGYLYLITSEKRVYFIDFEGFPYKEYELEKFSPLFQCKEKSTDYKHPYKAEDNGWQYIRSESMLIRDSFYEMFIKCYEKERSKNNEHLDILDITARALKIKKLERLDYLVNVQIWEREERERKALEKKRELLKLTAKDFCWESLYYNNEKAMLMVGEYALIFIEADEKVRGYQFSIIYQRKEISPLHSSLTAGVEAYNLFVKKFADVQGELCYKKVEANELGYGWFGEPEQTLNQYEINDYGEFVRSFQELEEAKSYAVAMANVKRYADKETIIRDVVHPKLDYKNKLRQCEAMVIFGERYHEVLEIVCQYEYPDEKSGGGAFILEELKRRTEIEEDLLKRMWKYVPRVLEKRVQEYAKKMMAECREKLYH